MWIWISVLQTRCDHESLSLKFLRRSSISEDDLSKTIRNVQNIHWMIIILYRPSLPLTMECRGVDETFIKESEVNTFSVQLTIVNFQLSIVNTFSVQLTANRPVFIIICMLWLWGSGCKMSLIYIRLKKLAARSEKFWNQILHNYWKDCSTRKKVCVQTCPIWQGCQ